VSRYTPLIEAMFLLRGSGRCEHFTHPVGACFAEGRTPDAEYGADKCCTACVADRALRDAGLILEGVALPTNAIVDRTAKRTAEPT
jgi:hypothetical protein